MAKVYIQVTFSAAQYPDHPHITPADRATTYVNLLRATPTAIVGGMFTDVAPDGTATVHVQFSQDAYYIALGMRATVGDPTIVV